MLAIHYFVLHEIRNQRQSVLRVERDTSLEIEMSVFG